MAKLTPISKRVNKAIVGGYVGSRYKAKKQLQKPTGQDCGCCGRPTYYGQTSPDYTDVKRGRIRSCRSGCTNIKCQCELKSGKCMFHCPCRK